MSISAHDWTTASSVDPEIFDRWPNYRVMLVAADTVDVASLAAAADQLIGEAAAHARTLEPGSPDAHIQLWHQAYRDFGVKPRVARVSVDALTRRAVSDAGLPRINVLVDIYNAISVLHQVPIGGEDLDRYTGPARLHLAHGNEPFLTNADGAPLTDHPGAGEPVWVDHEGVTCRRWNWRQTTRTAIRSDSTRVGFIIDSLEAPDHTRAEQAAQHLAALLGTWHTRTIDTTTR
jgi:DNA/RNA-binding domain of Phe-tRNA-synthetase-like protein